jgi:hypothetical protein
MGLKDRNNPLGQRHLSDKVGGTNRYFKHGQSAELVEEVKRKARKESEAGKPRKSKSPDYDISGPDRQPGKKVRQSNLGQQPRQPQDNQYTQDNEEEGPLV